MRIVRAVAQLTKRIQNMCFDIYHSLLCGMSVYLIDRRVFKRYVLYAVMLASGSHILHYGSSQAVIDKDNYLGIGKRLLKSVQEIADRRQHEKEAIVRPIRKLKLTLGCLTPAIVCSAKDEKCIYLIFLKKALLE